MKKWIISAAIVLSVAAISGGYWVWWNSNFYSIEKKEYHPSTPSTDLQLVDDRIEDKQIQFDPELIDSRPLEGGYQINLSAAVIKLDMPDMKPDRDAPYLKLQPSYAQAIAAAKENSIAFLPSANLLDGAAKQFDDGLYAAIDLAVYDGEFAIATSLPEFVHQLLNELEKENDARSFLAAALELAGKSETVAELGLDNAQHKAKEKYLHDFQRDAVRGKPIGFYTWTPELERLWKVGRFLQHSFDQRDMAVPRAIAGVLRENVKLKEQYTTIVHLYSGLTNPPLHASLLPLIADPNWSDDSASLLPASTSRETELFDKLFPTGIPDGTNLMVEFMKRIRAGEIDLTPRPDEGWYAHQVYALETLLLPELGDESNKLLLTAKYKKRLVEAFQALMTKRRETHARMLKVSSEAKSAMERPSTVEPRLRIEPCATFYLRTARAYAFLQNFLDATMDAEKLKNMYGLTAEGNRAAPLAEELESMKQRFYGFYLISCEDIGLRPSLVAGEIVDEAAAKQIALDWLKSIDSNADLRCDTRVCVPIATNNINGNVETHLWGAFGVRLAILDASFETLPSIRQDPDSDWEEIERYQLKNKRYLIAVDEFANFVLPGLQSFNRQQFRTLCDQQETKKEILEAIDAK
jgi:hypothetical protein